MNMMRMAKAYLVFALMIIINGNIASSADTNSLWDYEYNKSVFRNKSFTPSQFIDAIAMESKRMDPSGNGVSIFFKAQPNENNSIELKYTECDSINTLSDILQSGLSLMNMDCIIVGNSVLIGRQNTRSVATIITGRCYDSNSGAQIKGFQIESSPWNGIMSDLTNGEYLCTLPCQIRVAISKEAIFMPATQSIWQQEIIVKADGYIPGKYTIDILRPGNSPFINLDIELEKKEKGSAN